MGTFPPPLTGWDFVLDVDGTMVRRDAGAPYSSSTVKLLNDYKPTDAIESVTTNGIQSATWAISWTFPQPRDVRGFSCSYLMAGSPSSSVSTSVDSLDGVAGTWVQRLTHAELMTFQTNTIASTRSPVTVTWDGIRAIKLAMSIGANSSMSFYEGHIWGSYTNDGLMLWHPTLDRPLYASDVDYGDIYRATVHDRSFRVKNTNTLTATAIQVAIEATGDPSMQAGTDLHYNSSAAKTHLIGDLIPDEISGTIIARRTVSVSQNFAVPGNARIVASAGGWS